MDKTITTALLIVISMITALMLFNVAYPAVTRGGEAITSMANRTDEQMQSQIKVVYAAGELDKTGWWQDTNGNGDFEVFVWIKNVGASRITALDSMDIFFGQEGNFARIPAQSNANGAYPYWTAQIETGNDWVPTSTLKVTLHYVSPLPTGRYYFKAVTPTGVSDEYFLSM